MKRFFYITLFLAPLIALADGGTLASSTFRDVIIYILSIIKILIPILWALAFIVFFWGLSKFILNSGNKTEIEKGKNYMLWGILALFILLTFRVIITFISNDLGLKGDAHVIPLLPGGGDIPSVTETIKYGEQVP